MTDITRLLELAGMAKGPTIVSASTAKDGGINRTTANRMVDPRGYFQKNKDKNFGGKGSVNEFKDVLKQVEAERITEGPLRKLGMAATIAAGVMGSPHSANADTSPAMYGSTDTQVNQMLPWWEKLPTDVRTAILNRFGGPKAYVRKKHENPNLKQSDSAILDEWYRFASGLATVMQSK